MLIKAKCCYFLRSGHSIDVSSDNDTSLLYGEVSGSPLQTFETILSSQYKPLLSASNEWGEANNNQKDDFKTDMNRFIHSLSSALGGISDGLELRQPKTEYIDAYKSMDSKNFSKKISEAPDMSSYFENLVEEWCDQIEAQLLSSDDASGNILFPTTGKTKTIDPGPKGEIVFWRNRMQRLTSIYEQLKSSHCKNITGILSEITKGANNKLKTKVALLIRRWKQVDIGVTEAANEAKDNVKYLCSLQRFMDPLYHGNPQSIMDILPALLNSVKMIHTIARYYNTTERMTNLFAKITEQMIRVCKRNINGGEGKDLLWDRNTSELMYHLEGCLKLNELYQEQYILTKRKLQQITNGKQFDFNEMQIFGKFDLFCRRIVKLVDLFTTIHQFNVLSMNKLEGMDSLVDQFHEIESEFRSRNHDLFDYHNNKFDRDYVEFNVRISNLESKVQHFVNCSFENISSINHSLKLLHKFQNILHREALKADLDSKLSIIFQNYGLELENVQQLYEKQKHDPPIARNLPPVAGNIAWSRHLLKRIEEPMKQFEANQNLLNSKDAKRIIKMYNKVARTLVAFEFLWYKAWVQSIDQAKTGLQATLIIRHPDDGKLYVNFDNEILQLIREAKCLNRMGIDIPENAKIALFQVCMFLAV